MEKQANGMMAVIAALISIFSCHQQVCRLRMSGSAAMLNEKYSQRGRLQQSKSFC